MSMRCGCLTSPSARSPALAGITLSPKQVQRGTELAAERGLSNCQFKVGLCIVAD
jgi:hypothetical protein